MTEIIAPPERLLLRACLGDAEEAIPAFRAWRPHGAPGTLDGRNLRMMPLLYRNLAGFGFEDPYMDWLRGLAKHVWLTGSLRRRAVDQALLALDAAGIPLMLLKGAALLARWPETVESRPMGDFDILVAPDRARDAVACLREIGWSAPAPHLIADGDLIRLHALGLLRGRDISIDLHWRPTQAIGDPAHMAEVIARGESLPYEGRRVPSLADHFFILLAHAFRDLSTGRFDWVAEAVQLIRRAGERIDWALIDAQAERYRLRAWTHNALEEIARIGHVPLPPRSGRRPLAERLEIAVRAKRATTLLPAACDVRRAGRSILAEAPLWAHIGGLGARHGQLRQHLLFALLRGFGPPIQALAALGPDGFAAPRDTGGQSFLAGWSSAEPDGRWSECKAAWLLLRLPDRVSGPVALRLRANAIPPALAPLVPVLKADIWAGGAVRRSVYRGDEEEPVDRFLEGRAMAWRGGTVLPLFISFATPVDAAVRGNRSGDGRALGLFLRRLDLASTETIPELSTGVDLAIAGPAEAVCWSGWSHAEPQGRWTVGPEARLLVNPGAAGPRRVRLNVSQLFPPDQVADVSVDGAVVAQIDRPGTVEFPIGGEGLADIRVRPRAPVSPLALGGSSDPRVLGVMVRSVTPAGDPAGP